MKSKSLISKSIGKQIYSYLSINKLKKKINFLMKPKNSQKVMFLIGFLILLFLLHHFYLAKEGFESSPEDLEDNVSGQESIVLFYADWCGHCKKFMPQWDSLSSSINESNKKVKMMKVNCSKPSENEKQAQLMEKYKVQGYPTIIKVKNNQAQEYNGKRTKEDLEKFINS